MKIERKYVILQRKYIYQDEEDNGNYHQESIAKAGRAYSLGRGAEVPTAAKVGERRYAFGQGHLCMINLEYIIQSEFGDEYRLRITSEYSGMLSEDAFFALAAEGVEVVDVELERTRGVNVTSQKVLSKIADCIADAFIPHSNVIICFFCDFISLLPSMKKRMSVQEYRSKLFSYMFERYVELHHIDGVMNHVVTVKGVAEDYFAHVIYRESHAHLANMISQGIQQDYGK